MGALVPLERPPKPEHSPMAAKVALVQVIFRALCLLASLVVLFETSQDQGKETISAPEMLFFAIFNQWELIPLCLWCAVLYSKDSCCGFKSSLLSLGYASLFYNAARLVIMVGSYPEGPGGFDPIFQIWPLTSTLGIANGCICLVTLVLAIWAVRVGNQQRSENPE